MRALVYASFTVISAICLLLVLFVHFCAWTGMVSPLGKAVWLPHIAILILAFVFVPATWRHQPLGRKRQTMELIHAVIPKWAKKAEAAVMFYGFAHFGLFMLRTIGRAKGQIPESEVIRAFSSMWMCFAVALLTSFWGLTKLERKDAKGD